jgi:serine/threonine-protein kinase
MELRERLQSALNNAYTIDSELGGGGMSRVFVATEIALGRRVVVKILPPERIGGVDVERFRREIQLAAQLVHPHIVPLLSAGELDGMPFYTMPFVEGESLRVLLEREKTLSPSESVRLAQEIANALDYAHRRGIVHRDVKPENVLLHDGHALVTDFGIARAITQASATSTLTQAGVVLGTPAYMSPEQTIGERELDGSTDVYSLGCMLYEMLTGAPPFTGRTPQAVFARHLTEAAPSARRERPDVPEHVELAIRTALAKESWLRHATASDFARALSDGRSSTAADVKPHLSPGVPRGVEWPVWLRHLSGRYHWHRFTADGVQKAREGFERALERDPGYAPAYVGLAETYLILGGAPLNVLPSAETIPMVKDAARKAIELNPSDGSAYEPLALAQCWFEGAWEAARQTAIQGTQVDPKSARAWRAYAHTHCVCGLFDDAAHAVERFLELEPDSLQFHTDAAWIHYHARSYSRAEQIATGARKLEARFAITAYVEAEIRLAQGDVRGALAVMTPWRDEMRNFDYGFAILGFTLARNGDREDALRIATHLEEQCNRGRAAWSDVALVHLALDSGERSLSFLQRASLQRPFGGVMTAYLAVHPLFDPLRQNKRFTDVLQTLGLQFDRGRRPTR